MAVVLYRVASGGEGGVNEGMEGVNNDGESKSASAAMEGSTG